MKDCTLIIPYYRNPQMLAVQLATIVGYPPEWRVIIVDDGSPEPAEPIVRAWIAQHRDPPPYRFALYRIDVDIPWNREGARNLASRECQTEWMVHVDIDHVLPAECAARLLQLDPTTSRFYRFRRFRVGQADETRMKDRIPREQEHGEIHPHVDSYLCTKSAYWLAGGYNEDFSGLLGGGGEFLRRLGRTVHADLNPMEKLERERLGIVGSRDTVELRKLERAQRAQGCPLPTSWLRFPWHRVL